MTFHESFWAAVAAAAPVLGLGSIVSVIYGWLSGRMPSATSPTADVGRKHPAIEYIAMAAILLGMGNIFMQSILLYDALRSLGYGRNEASMKFALVAEPSAIILVLITGLIVGLLRWASAARGTPDPDMG
jgi:hypothetical protein